MSDASPGADWALRLVLSRNGTMTKEDRDLFEDILTQARDTLQAQVTMLGLPATQARVQLVYNSTTRGPRAVVAPKE